LPALLAAVDVERESETVSRWPLGNNRSREYSTTTFRPIGVDGDEVSGAASGGR